MSAKTLSTSDIMSEINLDEEFIIDLSNCIIKDFDLKKIIKKKKKLTGEKLVPIIYADRTIFKCPLILKGEKVNRISAKQAVFYNEVICTRMTCINIADFRRSKFYDNVDFNLSTFCSKSLFSECFFYKNCTFDKSSFNYAVTFKSSEFSLAPIFTSVLFSGLVFFQHARVLEEKGIIRFNDSTFESTVKLFDFACYGIDLNKSSNYAMLDFNPKDLRKSSIYCLSLLGMVNNGQININWDDFDVKSLIEDYPNEKELSLSEFFLNRAQQFALIKENYHNMGEYDFEDKAFLEHMRNKRKHILANKKYLLAFGYKIIDVIGLFGLSPLRIFKMMVSSWIFFVFIYMIKFSLGQSFSFTVVVNSLINSTFAFIGLGYSPVIKEINDDLFLFFISMESIIGYFLLSYYLVALVRRTLR